MHSLWAISSALFHFFRCYYKCSFPPYFFFLSFSCSFSGVLKFPTTLFRLANDPPISASSGTGTASIQHYASLNVFRVQFTYCSFTELIHFLQRLFYVYLVEFSTRWRCPFSALWFGCLPSLLPFLPPSFLPLFLLFLSLVCTTSLALSSRQYGECQWKSLPFLF